VRVSGKFIWVSKKVVSFGPCKAKEARSACKGRNVSAGPWKSVSRPKVLTHLRTQDLVLSSDTTKRRNSPTKLWTPSKGLGLVGRHHKTKKLCDKTKVLIVFPGTQIIMGQVHKKTVGRYILISYDFSIKLLHWSFIRGDTFFPMIYYN
jgi:hypothetical protein